MSVIFDTLASAEKLKAAGLPYEAAKAHVEILKEIIEDRLVTKEHFDLTAKEFDLKFKEVEARIRGVEARIKEVEARIKEVEASIKQVEAKIGQSEGNIIKWVIGMMIAQTGLMFGLLKFFIP